MLVQTATADPTATTPPLGPTWPSASVSSASSDSGSIFSTSPPSPTCDGSPTSSTGRSVGSLAAERVHKLQVSCAPLVIGQDLEPLLRRRRSSSSTSCSRSSSDSASRDGRDGRNDRRDSDDDATMHRRRASTLSRRRRRNSPLRLDDLANELVGMILEQLQHSDEAGGRRDLWAARLVSRRFCFVATPLCYRKVELNGRIVASAAARRTPSVSSGSGEEGDEDDADSDGGEEEDNDAEDESQEEGEEDEQIENPLRSPLFEYGGHRHPGLEHIYEFTHHVVVTSDLDAEGVRKVLLGTRRLAAVTWRYTTPHFRVGRLWMPSDVLRMLARRNLRGYERAQERERTRQEQRRRLSAGGGGGSSSIYAHQQHHRRPSLSFRHHLLSAVKPPPTVRLHIESLPLRDFEGGDGEEEGAGEGRGWAARAADLLSNPMDLDDEASGSRRLGEGGNGGGGGGTTTTSSYNAYLRAIPAELLASLSLANPTAQPPQLAAGGSLAGGLAGLKQLLLAARGLREFRFEDRGQGTRFEFDEEEEDADEEQNDDDDDAADSDPDGEPESTDTAPKRGRRVVHTRPAASTRLPPFTTLALRSYDWSHSPSTVSRHWDFSQLTSLSLTGVPTFAFLSSVPLAQLGLHLRRLRVDDYSAHLRHDMRAAATALLAELVGVHVPAQRLRELALTVRLDRLDVGRVVAARHGAALESLALHDHAGFRRGDAAWGGAAAPTTAAAARGGCPSLHPAALAAMAGLLPSSTAIAGGGRSPPGVLARLDRLELDLDAAVAAATTPPPQLPGGSGSSSAPAPPLDKRAFLRAVAAFPALAEVELHVQTRLRPYLGSDALRVDVVDDELLGSEDGGGGDDDDDDEEDEDEDMEEDEDGEPPARPDPDRESARNMVALLTRFRRDARRRAAAAAAEGEGPMPPRWRRITINVGGWRPVMARRLGEEWERCNARGIYAERCFVMEEGTGFREERSLEG